MRTPARPRLPDGGLCFHLWYPHCSMNEYASTSLLAWHDWDCSSTHPCAYCLLDFETLKDLEFRNRKGGFKRETTSAQNRRSRGGSRRFCPPGTRFRRSSLPARGTSLIPGRACSRWASRGGCSASRGPERSVRLSFVRGTASFVPTRGTPSPYERPKKTDWPFCQTSLSSAREAIASAAKPQPVRQPMCRPPESAHFARRWRKPATWDFANGLKAANADPLAVEAGDLRAKRRLSSKTGVFDAPARRGVLVEAPWASGGFIERGRFRTPS